ncbi:MAG: 4Fe-4S dicluster domain-containing protein [Candidatus Omnitrophica bacterium]|nr:4Fe-4S dicluster domain-containing protein [Candidatus Omnitrophota bacterium]
MKEVFCRIERCLGCRSCEIACAVEHSQAKELTAAIKENPLPKYRVRVQWVDERGDKVRLRSMALQCRQCAEPACAEACIAGGIVKDEAEGVVRFNQEKCVGCWSCLMVCPYGAIVRVPAQGIAVKCDHCPERETPACVEACLVHALVFAEPEEIEALLT